MQIKKVYEGWKNHILPEERKKDFIEYVSSKRMNVCNECEFHSKYHLSVRPDDHCTNCGCTLIAKTKCLTCECPLSKWLPEQMTENENT